MKVLVTVLMVLVAVSASAQEREPVIDMHLHALTADANGPPPLALCMSPRELPMRDPVEPWGKSSWRGVSLLMPGSPTIASRDGPTLRARR